MYYDPIEMRRKARLAFEKRKSDPAARLKFLQNAGIFDHNGNLNEKYFPHSVAANKK